VVGSPIDREDSTIKTDTVVNYETTHFTLNGSTLELEGYASVDGLYSYAEDRIRKTLIFKHEVDIEKFKEKNAYEKKYNELTDQEVIILHINEVPVDNCNFRTIKNNENSTIKDKDSIGGFRTAINLSEMNNGKPLKQGIYKIYIKLEQLLNENDDVKYEKIIPISDIKKYLTNGILTTHLEYFSASNTMKYNLI